MATDFFERQSKARRNTVWLIAMFLLAVIGIVATTVAIAALAVTGSQQSQQLQAFGEEPPPFSWEIPLLAGGGALALVIGGTLYKVVELRAGGGVSVAERLGGRRIYPNNQGSDERRLLNVVEEMAIASGTPVPPVFLLEESGINAFAAGYSSSDAVLGVTRGAIEQLSRDELQGVIAHEFSHLLNGDMRMSIRLIGILHGILLLGLLGHMLLRSAAFGAGRSRDRRGGGLPILAAAVALILIGFIGSIAGGLIKAAVSRQREFLADASAVQFTRNPGGIAGALKRIGASIGGSRVQAPGASEVSHLFFSQGVWEGFSGLMATHPPLPKRIAAIEPNWDGSFPKPIVKATSSSDTSSSDTSSGVSGLVGDQSVSLLASGEVDVALVDHAAGEIGDPSEVHRQYAAALIESLPNELLTAAHEPYGARAVVYCLLLDADRDVRSRQIAALRKKADPAVLRLASELQKPIAELNPQARLPLIDIALPALRSLSTAQFEAFDGCVGALIAADNQLALFEWTLGRIISRHLEPQYRKQRRVVIHYYGLGKLGDDCSMLLGTIAHVGHADDEAKTAFQSAIHLLPEVSLHLPDRDACSLAQLGETLTRLSRVSVKHRGRLVDACAEVICADGHVKLNEAELLRGISDLLDCPMPPILAGQSVAPTAAFEK